MTTSRLSSGLAQSTTPKRFAFLGTPVVPPVRAAGRLYEVLFELIFALHWQSPDEGHVNFRILASVFCLFLKQKFNQQD
jgi:hypothetical protein